MAHHQQKNFCTSVKEKFPIFFNGKWVLDIGSLDINGNNQYLFEQCGYIGVDLLPGSNVDFVSMGHELLFPDECFDVIISTECFEHDQYYEKTIKNIVRLLKPGGLFIFSCATTGRPEHGTRRTTPEDAPLIHQFGDWGDYYKNLEETDIRQVLDIDKVFSKYEFSTQNETYDLYFWGLKQGKLEVRKNYSFLNKDGTAYQLLNKLLLSEQNIKILAAESQHNLANLQANFDLVKSQLDSTYEKLQETQNKYEIEKSDRSLAVNNLKRLEIDLQQQKLLVSQIVRSKSWRLTRPLRFLARIMCGELSIAFKKIISSSRFKNFLIISIRIKNALIYLMKGNLKGFFQRIDYYKKIKKNYICINFDQKKSQAKWGIITSGHTLFIAHLIAERLNAHNWKVEIFTTPPEIFSHDIYIVLCPQIFDRLPSGEKRIIFQLEQSVSSRWFTDSYIKILNNSLAVLEYSLINLSFLFTKGICYPHVHYLPIGTSDSYGNQFLVNDKKFDVLFYGDDKSSPRRLRMLEAAKQHFKVHVVNEIFGDDLIQILKQARVILNIHYYENSLLEMPRIQECLSLGLKVVSESTQDQNEYPELANAVTFFEENSIDGMIKAIQKALDTNTETILHSIESSKIRFSFMFDRFLVGMGFISADYVRNMKPPLPKNINTFGLSLPETIHRRRLFEQEKPNQCFIFDGIRRRPGWVGCGLSYAVLAKHAIDNKLNTITVMEDDVILPADYPKLLDDIKKYLKQNDGLWDIFAGVIAVLHPDTKVYSVEYFKGRTFVTINKMTSTVFNIYSQNALRILSLWNPENEDAETNTIDRFLESRHDLRVVTTLPYSVGHREEVDSTLWGFQNSRYSALIAASEELLRLKVDEFLKMPATMTQLNTYQ